MSRLFASPEAMEFLREMLDRGGIPRLLARRAGRIVDRLKAATWDRGEVFPELPTWLRLAHKVAWEARIPRQEAQVRLAALRLLGDPQAAEQWVTTPSEEFGGRTPLRMARTLDGVHKVLVLVARLERERAAGRKACD